MATKTVVTWSSVMTPCGSGLVPYKLTKLYFGKALHSLPPLDPIISITVHKNGFFNLFKIFFHFAIL